MCFYIKRSGEFMKQFTLAFRTILFLAIFLSGVSCETIGLDMDMENSLLKETSGMIDKSQSNKFQKSRFIGDWILTNVTAEFYQDGKLINKQDKTEYWSKMEYSFSKDGSMMFFDSGGIWTYSHNFLIWKCNGSCYALEVMDVNSEKLVVREEEMAYFNGCLFRSYYQDKSGIHCFDVFEYERR